MSNQFEVLASRILEEKSKRFTEQNQMNLGNLLNPLKEKFGEFQFKVESLEKDSVAGRSELKVQIEQLRSLNEEALAGRDESRDRAQGLFQDSGRLG